MSEDNDWRYVWEVAELAASHPDQVLDALAQLQTLAEHQKHHALDRIGHCFARAGIEKPSLAECRAAIAAPDLAPRARRVWAATPATSELDEPVVAFLLEAFGCAETARTPRPAPDRSWQQPGTASSADQAITTRWQVEGTSCTIEVERSQTFFPGDVNEPARETEYVDVRGVRRVPPATVRVHAAIGSRELSILVDAAPEDRDRILTAFWRVFGE